MDGWISKLFLEEGGGGTGEESYELTALYYARFCEFTDPETRGVFFISGDESFYTTLRRSDVTRHIGPGVIDADMPVSQIFHELQRKFDVFVLYPRKPIEERRKAIDAELAKRLEREGAKSGDVTISLMWNTVDDLDLAVTTPGGFTISYAAKTSPCGGELDVDMNASAPYNTKPVENVYWGATGGAPLGKYKVEVNLYGFHSEAGPVQDVPFKCAVTINGETEMIEGVCTDSKRTVVAKAFTYTGKSQSASAAEEAEKYGKYSDENVLAAWASVIPPHRVLELKTPKAIADVMLGVLAVSRGGLTDSAYIKDLKTRGQDEARQEEVSGILGKWIAGEDAFNAQGGAAAAPPAGAELCRQASSGSSGHGSPKGAAPPAAEMADEMALLKAQMAAMQAENDRLRSIAAAVASATATTPEPEPEEPAGADDGGGGGGGDELAALRARLDSLSGPANKKARQKLNQKIRTLEAQQS